MADQLSSFEVMRLVQEFSSLKGAFLQKVYQPLKDLMVFRFNAKVGKKFLVLRVGKWMFLSDDIDIDLDPVGLKGMELPGIVRLFRKHISNGFITGVRQLSFDRIVEINIRKDMPYVLVLEMFGAGNVILTQHNTIVGALKPQVWRHRTIRTGVEYKPPPLRKDPRIIVLSELAVLLKQSRSDLVRTLATSVNLGGTYAEEVCFRTGLDKNIMPVTLEIDQMEDILRTIKEITDEVTHGSGGLIHNFEGRRADVTAIRLHKFAKEPIEPFAELSLAIKARFPLGQIKDEEVPSDFVAMIERLKHQYKSQEDYLDRFHKEIAETKAKADALYVNYQKVEKVLNEINETRESKGWKAVLGSFPDLVIDQTDATVTMDIPTDKGPRSIKLDLRKDLNENARVYYERSKHIKDKIGGADRAISATKAEIKRLEGLLEDEVRKAAETGRTRKGSRRRFWFESNRWFISKNGNVIVGGKDASGNRKVVKRYLKKGDRYIHADIHGAPSIVVKAADIRGRPLDIDEDTLRDACHYAICFSKAWAARIGSGEAYWVTPEQVSTKPQSGEFLPRGGFIIRGKRNLIRNLELELSIGVIEIDGTELIMCAPAEVMKDRCPHPYRLVPSKAKKSTAARALAKEFSVRVEEIEAILPPGGVTIIGLDP